MKKVVLTIVAGISMQVAVAQKFELTNAILAQQSGKLDQAKTAIDKASTNEKTMTMSKTWFYKGEIYRGMIESPIFKKNAPADAAKIAYDAYDKYLQMEPKGEYAKGATDGKTILFANAFNAGVSAQEAKDYDKALENYAIASSMRPEDTGAVLNSAIAAVDKNDFAKAKQYYRKMTTMSKKPLPYYNRMIDITMNQEKNPTETLKLVEEARTKYPNDRDLMTLEASLYIAAGRGKEAITKLEGAIAGETDATRKSNLYAALGSLHEQNKNPEAALASYKKAVEANPGNFDAQFNLGVYQYNKGADLYNKANKMDYATYQKSGAKLETQAKGMFSQAIPYFEAALKIDPTSTDVMKSLSQIYVKLGRNADAERMNKMMDEAAAAKKKK